LAWLLGLVAGAWLLQPAHGNAGSGEAGTSFNIFKNRFVAVILKTKKACPENGTPCIGSGQCRECHFKNICAVCRDES
jgi:hypothetical protein